MKCIHYRGCSNRNFAGSPHARLDLCEEIGGQVLQALDTHPRPVVPHHEEARRAELHHDVQLTRVSVSGGGLYKNEREESDPTNPTERKYVPSDMYQHFMNRPSLVHRTLDLFTPNTMF